MMSQTDSASRAAPALVAAAGEASRPGKFMSAILTYFALLITPETATESVGARRKKSGLGPIGAAEPPPAAPGGNAMDKPYDRLDGVIWYDGKVVPWGEANLHVLSHGLHYASCVFEG